MKVHFNEQEMIQVKIFKATDSPSAPNISEEEYMQIQEEVRKNPHIFKVEEMRKKEITMDINQQKEPEITWHMPVKLHLEIVNIDTNDSKQKNFIDDLCDKVLSVNYFGKISEPNEGESKLFSFTDDNIPKIENSRIATRTNDVTIADISCFLDSIDNNLNGKNLKKLKELLEKVIDLDEESKNLILEQAQKNFEQENYKVFNNPIINNNNTNNSNFVNSQRIFQIQNFSNQLMNLNNLTQMAGAAMSVLNNYQVQQQMPQTLAQIQQQSSTSVQSPFVRINNTENNYLINKNNDRQGNNPNFNNIINISNSGNINNSIISNNNIQNGSIDQRMIMESAQRMNISKYKTKPCRNYHGSQGCTRGENCFFIHDRNYIGKEIPNFNPRNYERNFPFQLPTYIAGQMNSVNNISQINQYNSINQMNQINSMNQRNSISQAGLGLSVQQMIGLPTSINNNNNNLTNLNPINEQNYFKTQEIVKTKEESESNSLISNTIKNGGLISNNNMIMPLPNSTSYSEIGMAPTNYNYNNYNLPLNQNSGTKMVFNGVNTYQ